MPQIPITLVTDMPEVPSRLGPFHRIVKILPSPTPAKARESIPWGQGLLSKVRGLAESPYQRTLFLDTDTRVLSARLGSLFERLNEVAFAAVPCTTQSSRSCALYGPMFNTGVLLYRDTAAVRALLRAWAARQAHNLALAAAEPPGEVPDRPGLGAADRRFLLGTDQLSLAQLLRPDRVPAGGWVGLLEERWNARCRPPDQLEGVVIDHANRHKVLAHQAGELLRARGIAMPSLGI